MENYVGLLITIPAGIYLISLGFGLVTPPTFLQGRKYAAFILGFLVLLGGLASTFANFHAAKAELAARFVHTTRTNNEFPIQIDELTTMDAVASEGATVILDFSLMTQDGQSLSDLVLGIETYARENACNDLSFKDVLEVGVSITMRYSSTDGADTIAFQLPPELCDS